MKKLLSVACVALATLSFAHAQQTSTPDFIDAKNLALVQKLSRHTRDSIITEIKKQGFVTKSNKVTINGKDMSSKMAAPMNKFTTALSGIMIAALATDDPAVIEKNQEKYFALEEELNRDMDELSDQLNYEEDRQKIIDKFNNGKYDDAKEKSEAKKEMNEDLRELKKDFKEELKEKKEKEKKRAEREARRK